MKKRIIQSYLVIAVFFFLSGPILASQTTYTTFLEKLHERYESSSRFRMDWFNTLAELNKFGNQAPRVSRFQNAIRELSSSFDAYRENTQQLQQILRNNRGAIKLPKNLRADLNQDTEERFRLFQRVVGELSMFSQSIREHTFTLYANEPWANSGVQVQGNDLVWVNATGSWSMKSSGELTDWQGYRSQYVSSYGYIKDAPLGTLLYRIRGASRNAELPLAESQYAMILDRGRLEFMANDMDLANNVGQLDLNIVTFNWEQLSQLLASINQLVSDI